MPIRISAPTGCTARSPSSPSRAAGNSYGGPTSRTGFMTWRCSGRPRPGPEPRQDAMQRSRIASFSIVAGANILAIAAGLVALELFFGGWFADYHPPSGSIFGRTFTLEQHYYEPHSTVVYTRDQYGLRGSTTPIDKIELVTVGGSTTDQRFITEGETWQDVIHALTGLAITNAGDEGISSTGHVVAVAEWLHLIPNFHPHFYLHYIGVNDAAYAFFATRPQSREAILAHLEDEKNRRALHRIVRGRSAIIQSYLRLKDWFSGPPAVFGAPAPPPKTLGPELSVDVDRTPIVDYIERIYQPNLLRLF